MLIAVESVTREVDFMENEGKTMILEAKNRLSVSEFWPMPRVQRGAAKVERGKLAVFGVRSSYKNHE